MPHSLKEMKRHREGMLNVTWEKLGVEDYEGRLRTTAPP